MGQSNCVLFKEVSAFQRCLLIEVSCNYILSTCAAGKPKVISTALLCCSTREQDEVC